MTPVETRRQRDRLVIGLGAISLLCLLVTIVVGYTTVHNRAQLLDQAAGRRVVVVQSCAIQKSIIDAGRQILESSVLLPGDRLVHGKFIPGPVTRSLGPNYPSYAERVRRTHILAAQYEAGIVGAVVREVHEAGIAQVPIRGGHLDCHVFSREVGQP